MSNLERRLDLKKNFVELILLVATILFSLGDLDSFTNLFILLIFSSLLYYMAIIRHEFFSEGGRFRSYLGYYLLVWGAVGIATTFSLIMKEIMSPLTHSITLWFYTLITASIILIALGREQDLPINGPDGI